MPLLEQNLQIFTEKQAQQEENVEFVAKKEHVKSDTTTDLDFQCGKFPELEINTSEEGTEKQIIRKALEDQSVISEKNQSKIFE